MVNFQKTHKKKREKGFTAKRTGRWDGQGGRRAVRGHEIGELPQGPEIGRAATLLHLFLDQHIQLLSEGLPADTSS